MNVEKGHCQRQVEYIARTPTSYFAAIDFPRFFRFDNAWNLAGGIDAWAGLVEPGMARY